MKKTMQKASKKCLALFMALALTLTLLPVGALAADATITLRVQGATQTLVDTTVSVPEGTSVTAALTSALGGAGYTLSTIESYGSTYVGSITKAGDAVFDAAHAGYWGQYFYTGGAYDTSSGLQISVTNGGVYCIYYYRTYNSAWFKDTSVSGAVTGTPVAVTVDGVDSAWNTGAMPNLTVYATGGAYASATAVGVTDTTGKAYIVFDKADTYTLTLADTYTYSKCTVTVSGSDITLNPVSVAATPTNSAITLSKDSGQYSPYSVSGGTYLYRLADGIYNYSTAADGYLPASGTLTLSGGTLTASSGTLTVSGGTTGAVSLAALTGSLVTVTTGNASETVTVKTDAGVTKTSASHTDSVWTYDLVDGSYTYTVSRSGYHSAFGSFAVSGAALNLTTTALADTAAAGADDWYAFRDYGDNMATGSFATPKGAWQAEEDWATSLGALGTWGTLSASNIVKYDGYLYVATEHGLCKLSATTGNLLKTAPLGANTGYVLQIAYGGGKVFVTTEVGIDAFDALTMERLWTKEIYTGCHYMASTPILFDSVTDTVFVGDYGDDVWGTYGTFGGYSAIDATTGAGVWTLWGGATDARYWAGAVIAGNYLVFGSNSGTLTSLPKTGADADGDGAIDEIEISGTLSITGEINSSVAYDGTYLYVTTKSGYIYKMSINNTTGALAVVASRQFTTGSTTSTPLVYNGRVYVGAANGFSSGWVYVLNASDFSEAAKFTTSAAVASSGLLTTAYSAADGAVYVYFTVNSGSGEILVLKDDGAAPTCEKLYVPSHAQYCMNSLIAGGDGTLYYCNDSGYLFAISGNGTSRDTVSRVTVSVTPASNGSANPSVTVTGGGTQVDTGTYYLAAGSYPYSVSLTGYDTATGTITVSADDVTLGSKTVPVTLTETSVPDPDITVSFTLRGFSAEPSTSVTLEAGATVADVIAAASSSLGFIVGRLDADPPEDDLAIGYIKTVKYNGVTLAEGTMGAQSGWEYRVNGILVLLGIKSQTVQNGDAILLYYTEDYTPEWDDTKSETQQVELQLGSGTLEITATQDGSALSFELDDEDIDSLIGSADASGSVNIDLSSVSGINTVTLNKTALSAISSAASGGSGSVTGATIKTEQVSVNLSAAALAGIVKQAGGDEVTIGASAADKSALTAAQQEAVGANPVFDLSMKSGDTAITQFGGEVTISIPYAPEEGQLASGFKVFYIDQSGNPQEVEGAYYDAAAGCVVFSTTHFSLYMIGYRPFADVNAGDWFYNAAYACFDNGLFKGTGDTAFSPETTMTREMFVTVLYRLAGEPDVSGETAFSDAGEIDSWALAAVRWASGNGIVSGYPDGTFAPKNEVTREQMTQILYQYAAYRGYDVSGTDSTKLLAFADGAAASGWALGALSWAVNAGILGGNGDGTVDAQGYATRAQVAQIICNFMDCFVKA